MDGKQANEKVRNAPISAESTRTPMRHISCKRGQISAEFISILGIGLLIVLLFLALSASRLFDVNQQQNYDNAHTSVSALAEAANSVYAQGEGASRVVSVVLPGNTEFSKSYIGSPAGSGAVANMIDININGTDTVSITDAPLSGSFPSTPGTYQMEVLSRGSYVSIITYLIDLDSYSISISMGKNQTRGAMVRAYRTSAEGVNLTAYSGWNFPGAVNLSVSPSSFQATPAGTVISLQFNSSSGASGFYSSQLIIAAQGDASGANESITVPITVNVK